MKTNKQSARYPFFIFIAIFAVIAVLLIVIVRAGSDTVAIDVTNESLSVADEAAYGSEFIEFKEAQTDDGPSPIPGRKLLWSDEFNYSGEPNPAYWSYEVGKVRNDEAQYYTDNRRENARVEDGNLVVEARKEDYKGSKYTSASVISLDKYEFTYGRLEFRAKFTAARGTWPALWTLGGYKWPIDGEIDVMENIGFNPKDVFQAVHKGTSSNKTSKGQFFDKKINTSDYNIYAIEWTKDKIDFYINGDKNFTVKGDLSDPTNWPFTKDQFIIMNIAIGGGWGGQQGIDDSTFPHFMHVDYVRVYESL